MAEAKTKTKNAVRALKRTGAFIPEPEIRLLTVDEIYEALGDPYEGQLHRYGEGKDAVDKLWTPEALALEIHDSPQATMVRKLNIECWEDEAGKFHREGGNRTQLALRILKNRYGDKDVEVVIDTETPDGRAVKLRHKKNYGGKFPVKFYGKLDPAQVIELGERDNRATKKKSEADFFFSGWKILKTTTLASQPGKEKKLVKTMGAGEWNAMFPYKPGLTKKGKAKLPCISIDEETGDITINGRENVQTVFRLANVPDFAAMAFFAGLAGEGPMIPKRALVKLEEAWGQDKERLKNRINSAMSREDVEKVFESDPKFGKSALLANLDTVTAKKAAGTKKITPWTGAEMQKYADGILSGTTTLPILMKIARRDPGYADDKVVTALVEYVMEIERLGGPTHPKLQALFDLIDSKDTSTEDEESSDEEENGDEDEGKVDPETGEPLTAE